MLCFHGMTEKAFKQWLNKENKDSLINVASPWTCSDSDGFTYLHTIEHAFNECSTEDTDEAISFAIQQAKESAIIQAAINDDSTVFVFQLEIPDEHLIIDNSCENMDYCRCIDSNLFNKFAESATIQSFSVKRALHVFRIAGLINNPQFNKHAIDPDTIKAAEIVAQCDYSRIIDELFN
jgi:hypothetical protein